MTNESLYAQYLESWLSHEDFATDKEGFVKAIKKALMFRNVLPKTSELLEGIDQAYAKSPHRTPENDRVISHYKSIGECLLYYHWLTH